MKKVYEATGNIHIPELKCSANKGTRVEICDEMFTMNGTTIPTPYNFQLLLKHGLFKELSEKEAETPEVVEVPQTVKHEERQKMRIEYADENKIPIVAIGSMKNEDDQIQESDIKLIDEKGSVRGMKVIEDESVPFVGNFGGSSDEKKATASNLEVRPNQKQKSANEEDMKKKDEAAAKIREERIKKIKVSQDKK